MLPKAVGKCLKGVDTKITHTHLNKHTHSVTHTPELHIKAAKL